MIYHKKQISVLLLLTVGLALLSAFLSWNFTREDTLGLSIALGAVVLLCLSLSILRVSVSSEFVRAAFGLGWPQKTFRWEEIQEVRAVRNPWYYGWGIRKIPSGWMYNVSGLSAVELVLKNGRVFRIGTAEPEALLHAIQQARSS